MGKSDPGGSIITEQRLCEDRARRRLFTLCRDREHFYRVPVSKRIERAEQIGFLRRKCSVPARSAVVSFPASQAVFDRETP